MAAEVQDIHSKYPRGSPQHVTAMANAQERYERALMQAGRDDAAVRNVFGTGVRLLSNLLINLPNSRRAESEADLVRTACMCCCVHVWRLNLPPARAAEWRSRRVHAGFHTQLARCVRKRTMPDRG